MQQVSPQFSTPPARSIMGCAASVEPKPALPPVQRYNFVGPEIRRSSSMLDAVDWSEICPSVMKFEIGC